VNTPIVRPSSAFRWAGAGCTQSTLATDDRVSRSAAEGNRLHDLAANVIRGDAALDDISPSDRAVIEPYTSLFTNTARGCLFVEKRVDATIGPYSFGGTPDAVAIERDAIEITDLKTGFGIVEVFENWQLLSYAMIWAAQWTAHNRFVLRIVQPRVWHSDGPVREWVVTREQVESYGRKIRQAVMQAHMGPRYVASASGCRYCPRRATCPALRSAALHDADAAGFDGEIPDAALRGELDTLREAQKRLALRVDALEEHVIGRIMRGEKIPGVSLHEKQGRLSWNVDDTEALNVIRILTGRDITKKSAPTPTQAIKLGIPKNVIDGLAARKPGRLEVSTENKSPFEQTGKQKS